jgi:hypothetical protein
MSRLEEKGASSGRVAVPARKKDRKVRLIVMIKITNWKKGFNRLYFVVVLCWILFQLVILPIQQRNRFVEHLHQEKMSCQAQYQISDPQYKRCSLATDAGLKFYDDHGGAWPNFRDDWPRIIALIVVLPFACYWLIRAGALLFLWIRRGFVS